MRHPLSSTRPPYIHILSVILTTALSGLAQSIDFERDVWPILDARCIKCHQAPHTEDGKLKKPKGGLMLDAARAIMHGGDNGGVVVVGKPNESSFYTWTTLDEDDEDIMPAKGDPLTAAQQKILHDWIKQGAAFGDWKGNPETLKHLPAEPEAPAPARIHPLDTLAKGIPRLHPSQYSKIPKATVMPVAANNALLRVTYVNDPGLVTDTDISKLAPLLRYVTDLDLSRTKVTTKSMRLIGSMRMLTDLDLHDTELTDADLAYIRGLDQLECLNLHNTALTDKSLKYIAQLKKLDRLYVWNTKISKKGIYALKKALPRTLISYDGGLPYPETVPSPSESTDSRRRRTK